MNTATKQEQFWSGEFGKNYTDRNSRSNEEWDKFYLENWGISKVEMNNRAYASIDKNAKILEVGCNTGMQLVGFQRSGFEHIYGIELQPYAVEKAKEFTKNINIIQGSGFDIPFKDNYFDLVCTNGVLIHIAPDNLPKIMDEMVRCSKRYISGFEYFSPLLTSINYRGNNDYLWKADYAQLFLDRYPNLKLLEKTMYPYINQVEIGNVDCLYLLEKV